MIKLAASAASPKTEIQEFVGASSGRLGMWMAGTATLPWILIVGEAVLAADLIMARKPFQGGYASSRLDHGCTRLDQAVAIVVFLSGCAGTPFGGEPESGIVESAEYRRPSAT